VTVATLRRNGVELARIRAKRVDPEFDETIEREYSIGTKGWVLRKSRFISPRYSTRTWTGWTRAFKWGGDQRHLDHYIRAIRENLTLKQGFTVLED